MDFRSLRPEASEVRRRVAIVTHEIERQRERVRQLERERKEIEAFLAMQPRIAARLEELSKAMFRERLREIEENLSYALQDVLGQEIKLRSEVDIKRQKVWIRLFVERDGYQEDILRGQGGSVCNILSVGLRLIALSQLDEREHRRFVVLDEQDCWIRPDLVPRFMSIIYTISKKLGYQVVVISHHDVASFRDYADRIYHLALDGGAQGAVKAEVVFEREE